MQRPRTNRRRSINDLPHFEKCDERPTILRQSSSVTRRSCTKSVSLALCLIGTVHMLTQCPVNAFSPAGNRHFSRTIRRTRLEFPSMSGSSSSSLPMVEKAIYGVDANGQPVKTYTSNTEAEESSTVMSKRIVKLLSDDQGEEDDQIPDYSEEAANEIADKKVYSRISEEAKWKANNIMKKNVQVNSLNGLSTGTRFRSGLEPMIENKIRAKPPTKVMASVKETGGDSMREYIKSMGQHELLPQESELLLGRHIQLLVKWEGVRSELEKEFDR